MYLPTREGLGLDQTTWSASQAIHGYGAHLSDAPESAESKACITRYQVSYFQPGSSALTAGRKRRIQEIARHIAGLYARKFPALQGKADLDLHLLFEGHVDKKTDPKNYGTLDRDRAAEVAYYLDQQLEAALKRKGIFATGTRHFHYSSAGPDRPRSSTPRKNRRVVVCIQKWETKKR